MARGGIGSMGLGIAGRAPTKQEAREARERSGANAEFARHRMTDFSQENSLVAQGSAIDSHGSTLSSLSSTASAHATRLGGHDAYLSSLNNTAISHATRLNNHDTSIDSLSDTAAGHSTRITTAQNAANAADARAENAQAAAGSANTNANGRIHRTADELGITGAKRFARLQVDHANGVLFEITNIDVNGFIKGVQI